MKLICLEEDLRTNVTLWLFSMNAYSYRSLQVVIRCRSLYFVIPSIQLRFPIGGEHVWCRQSKLTNSPGKQQHELSTRTWSGRAHWNRGKFVSAFFFYFWVWLRLGEHWGSRGNKNHCWNQSRSSKSRFYLWSLFFPTCACNLRIHDKRGWFLTLLIRKPLWNNKCYMFT